MPNYFKSVFSHIIRKLIKKPTKKVVKLAVINGIDTWLNKSTGGYDFWKIGCIMAAADTAEYFQENMPTAPLYESRIKLHLAAIKEKTLDGLILEFGVAGGVTVNRFADAFPQKIVYGFDSFQGLPEAWRSDYQKGHFAQEPPEVRKNVQLVSGWFDESLPKFLENHPEDVSFLHIDCDLYSSTSTILELLADRIKLGTVVIFDEYFNYPGWRNHEHKAFSEFLSKNNLSFKCIGAVRNNKQLAVIIN